MVLWKLMLLNVVVFYVQYKMHSKLHFFFIKNQPSVILCLHQCTDTGYHLTVGRVMRAYLSRWSHAQRNLSSGLQQIQGTVSSLDQNQDRDHLLQTHNNTFCLPLRFQYQPHDGDQVCLCVFVCVCMCISLLARQTISLTP